MHAFPLSARLYIIIVWLIALVLSWYLAPTLLTLAAAPLLSLCALIGYALAWYGEVNFTDGKGNHTAWTVDEAVCLLLITIFGGAGVWLVVSSFALVGVLRRRPLIQLLFNLAMLLISYSLAAQIYTFLQPADQVPFSGMAGPLVFVATASAYYLCNMVVINNMISLATKQPLIQVYRHNMLQINWVQLLVFTIGAAMAALYAIDDWLLLYGVLTLILARYAFATVAALNAESQQRAHLAEEQAHLYAERVRLAEELNQKQEELALASKLAALGTFAAGIAHEFNNVLTAILGHAQLARMTDTNDEKDYSLDVIARVTKRATGITASLLTFARQRKPDLELAPLQIAIKETLQLVTPDLQRDQIHFSYEIAELPPTLCDLGQINQVLLNLITNARDALRGRPDAALRLTMHQEADAAFITIADHGPGMAPEVLERLFQPFVTTKQKGNGLGMAICYGIVESHKGRIEVHSHPNRGTTITIRLPIRDQLDAEELAANTAPELAETASAA
jgi:signal transduction histidine kinase